MYLHFASLAFSLSFLVSWYTHSFFCVHFCILSSLMYVWILWFAAHDHRIAILHQSNRVYDTQAVFTIWHISSTHLLYHIVRSGFFHCLCRWYGLSYIFGVVLRKLWNRRMTFRGHCLKWHVTCVVTLSLSHHFRDAVTCFVVRWFLYLKQSFKSIVYSTVISCNSEQPLDYKHNSLFYIDLSFRISSVKVY